MPAQQDLFNAAENNNVALATQALRDGAKLEAVNELGETPLLRAARAGHKEIAEFLLTQGSQVNARDNQLRSVLHWSVYNNHADLIKLFRGHGAEVNVSDFDGETPLKLASYFGHTHLYQLLTHNNDNNYHTEMLALRADVMAIVTEEDVISGVQDKLVKLTPNLDRRLGEKVTTIVKQCLQPELLLDWSAYKVTKEKKSSQEPKSSVVHKPEQLQPVDLIVNADLKTDDHLFIKINMLIKEIEEFMHANTEKSDPAKNKDENYRNTINQLFVLLRKIKTTYLKFRFDVCQQKGLLRKELCEGRIRATGFMGNRYINNGVSLRFKSHMTEGEDVKEDPLQLQRDHGLEGEHPVFRVINTFYKVKPGFRHKNFVIGDLYDDIFGRGCTRTQDITIKNNRYVVPVLTSKAAEGMEFHDLIVKRSDLIPYINAFDISMHTYMSVVTVSTDYKAASFFAEFHTNPQTSKPDIHVPCIDYDMALSDPITVTKKKDTFFHNMELQSIFLLLPQTDDPVDPNFRRTILAQHPILIMLKWLKNIFHREEILLKEYLNEQSVNANTHEAMLALLTSIQFKNNEIGLKLLPGTFLKVYERMCRIYHALQNNPNLTNNQLVATVFPIVADHYAVIRSQNKHILERYNDIRRIDLEVTLKDKPEHLNKLTEYKRTYDGNANDEKEAFTTGCQTFINNFDYGEISDALIQRQALTQNTTHFPFLTELVIRNCSALDDSLLENLSTQLRNLKSLTLINCPNFTGTGLYAVLENIPGIKMQLNGFAHISASELLNLLMYCENLSFVINNTIYEVKKDFATLMHIAAESNHSNLFAALLLYSAQLTPQKGQEVESALNTACQKGELKLVINLLDAGAVPDESDPKKETPLDITFNEFKKVVKERQSDYLNIIKLLIERGAIYCQEPAEIMQLLIKNGNHTPGLKQALFRFARLHGVLQPEHIRHLIQPNTTSLTLAMPTNLENAKCKLTPELITALPTHLSKLEELDLTHADGLSDGSTRQGMKELGITKQAIVSPRTDEKSVSTQTVTAVTSIERIKTALKNITSLKSLYVSADQALALGLSLENIHDLSNLYLSKAKDPIKIKVYITSLRLNDNPHLVLDQIALLKILAAIHKASRENATDFVKRLKLDDNTQGNILSFLTQAPAPTVPLNLALDVKLKIAYLINDFCKNNDFDFKANPELAPYFLLKICSFLRKTSSITNIEMCSCELGPIEAALIAGAIEGNRSLKRVFFHNNPNLGDEGGYILISTLSKLPNIAEIHMDGLAPTPVEPNSNTGVLPKTAAAVGKLITECPTLEKLSLHLNYFGEQGITIIANTMIGIRKELRKNLARSLNYLDLNETAMNEKSAIAIAHALIFCTKLEIVDLDYNALSNSAAEAFIYLLGLNRSITLLKATKIGCDPKFCQQIKDLNQANKQLKQRQKLEEFRKREQTEAQTQCVIRNSSPEIAAMRELELHNRHLRARLLIGQQFRPVVDIHNRSSGSSNSGNSNSSSSSSSSSSAFFNQTKPKVDIKAKITNKLEKLIRDGYQFAVATTSESFTIQVEKAPQVNLEKGQQNGSGNEVFEFFLKLVNAIGKLTLGAATCQISQTALIIDKIPESKMELLKSLVESGIVPKREFLGKQRSLTQSTGTS